LPNIGKKGEFQRVWVDSRTRLPVSIEFFGKDDTGKETLLRTATEIVFGGKLDPKLFHLELPPDYRIEPKDDVNKLDSTTDNRSVYTPLQISFADVLKTMKEVKTVTYTVTMQELGPAASILEPGDLIHKIMISSHLLRQEMLLKGKVIHVVISDQKADKLLILDTLNKIAYINNQFDEPDTNNPGNLSTFELFRTYHSSKTKIKKLPEKTIDGKKYPGFEFKLVEDKKDHNWYGRVWVDPVTKFPVYEEKFERHPSGQTIQSAIHTDFVFGKELDSKLFDLTPPGDYVQKQLQEMPPITIEPPK
jgi:outer membrane lipoprotein-sorting protein